MELDQGGAQGGGRGRNLMGRGQQGADQNQAPTNRGADKGKAIGEGKEGSAEAGVDSSSSVKDSQHLNVVCFNCGEIGHYSSGCGKAKVCFICHQTEHVVDNCPEWLKVQLAAQYYGNANSGLGFYHIDVTQREGRFKHWSGMDNYALLAIVKGMIDEEGILENLRNLF